MKLKIKEQTCENCGSRKVEVKDYRKQIYTYISPFGKMGEVIISFRRYKCLNCNRAFKEKNKYLDNILEKILKIVYFD